jgi:hypothetical protein
MATKPLNDTVLVELDNKKYGSFSSSVAKEGHETGTLVAVSDKIFYLSSFSYVLEDSFKYPEKLEELRKYWEDRIGKQLRWEARADQGTSFDEDGEKFACIKITKLIGEIE